MPPTFKGAVCRKISNLIFAKQNGPDGRPQVMLMSFCALACWATYPLSPNHERFRIHVAS